MILICGNYGATNLGDEAILDGILKKIRTNEATPRSSIIVLSYNPLETKKLHNVESRYLFPMGFRSFFRGVFKGELWKTLQAYKKCGKFMLGGGGLFTDEKLFAVILWSWHVFLARVYGKPIEFYGIGVGPLNTRLGRYLTRKACNLARKITVRDQESKDLLIKLGIKQNIKVIPDPALTLSFPKSYQLKAKSFPFYPLPPTTYALLSLRPWIHHEDKILSAIPPFLDYLIEKHQLNILMIPFQRLRDNDSQILQKVRSLAKNQDKIHLLPFDPDYRNVMKLYQDALLIIGMRLHSLIFAWLLKKPFIGLIYSQKVKSFLKSIKKEEQGIEIENLSEEKLKKMIKN